MRTVLLSVKPEYANRILEGSKRFEFRRTRFAQDIETVFLYVTAPVSRIVGYFVVIGTETGSPHTIWRKCKTAAGIQRKDFFSYYRDAEIAFALIVGEVTEFKDSVDPRELWPTFSIPQSYKYLDSSAVEMIVTGRV